MAQTDRLDEHTVVTAEVVTHWVIDKHRSLALVCAITGTPVWLGQRLLKIGKAEREAVETLKQAQQKGA